MTDSENKTGLPEENIDSVPAPKENESTSTPAPSEEAQKPETPAAPQEAKSAAPETSKSAKPSGRSASDAKKSADAKDDGLSGVGLAVSLCDAVLLSVGREHFHGGVRPDNISVRGSKAYLGGTLQHIAGEFTPQELEYMAPELFWDGVRDSAADVYSIGLILYSLYNYGRLPFWPSSGAITPNARASALQKRMSDEEITPPASADAELAGIILRALAFRTEDRWHDAQELKDALNGCDAAGETVDISLAMSGLLSRSSETMPSIDRFAGQGKAHKPYDTGEIPPGRRPERRKSLRWLWTLILAVVVIGAAVLVYVGKNNTPSAVPETEPTATPVPTAAPTATPTPSPDPTPSPTPKGPRYVVYVENLSWTQAQQRCEELGGTLAAPMTEDEYNEIVRVCTSAKCNYVWLGAERQADGNWRDTNGDLIGYFLWDEGEPTGIDTSDNAPENYLMLWRRDDGWYYNDSRENPLLDYYWIYGNNIGFVCQMW